MHRESGNKEKRHCAGVFAFLGGTAPLGLSGAPLNDNRSNYVPLGSIALWELALKWVLNTCR